MSEHIAFVCCKHHLAKTASPVCLECYKELQQERDESARLAQDAFDERDILRAALLKYGHHIGFGKNACAAEWPLTMPEYKGKCTCGLTNALGGTDG